MFAIRCGLLFDGIQQELMENMVLIIEDNYIKEIKEESSFSPNSFNGEIIDMKDKTIIPGLINTHVHLAMAGKAVAGYQTEAEEALTALINAKKTIASGVTTIRDCGALSGAVINLGNFISEGLIEGPRIIASGTALTTTGGHIKAFAGREVDGPIEMCKAAREEITRGAKTLKIIATGGVLTPGTEIGSAQFSVEEMKAAIDVAKRVGVTTCSHAIGTEGIMNSVLAGIDSIEHGSFLTEEIAQMMIDRNVYHTPTLSAYYTTVKAGTEAGIPKSSVEKATKANNINIESFKMSYKMGVKFVTGTDAGTPFNYHDKIGLELELMVEKAGVRPIDALMAATSNAADLLRIDDLVGRLEAGKIADFVVIDGNPIEDISSVSNVVSVYKEGKQVHSIS